jgi:hypothetical protein
MKILRNYIHDNGQIGITGIGANLLIEGNEISTNTRAGYDYFWEAGGMKLSLTRNAVVRNNFAHDNLGAGLWTDINNYNTLYEQNHTRANLGAGIMHEISYHAIIRNNIIEEERGRPGPWGGGGILIAESSDVEVYGNTLIDCNNGIVGVEVDRELDPETNQPYHLRNLSVHDNVIEQKSGTAAAVITNTGSTLIFAQWNNRFTHNTYLLPDGTGRYFEWLDHSYNSAEWQASGNDTDGTFTSQ